MGDFFLRQPRRMSKPHLWLSNFFSLIPFVVLELPLFRFFDLFWGNLFRILPSVVLLASSLLESLKNMFLVLMPTVGIAIILTLSTSFTLSLFTPLSAANQAVVPVVVLVIGWRMCM